MEYGYVFVYKASSLFKNGIELNQCRFKGWLRWRATHFSSFLFCVESHLTLLGEFSASFEGAFEIVGKSNNISLGFEEKERGESTLNISASFHWIWAEQSENNQQSYVKGIPLQQELEWIEKNPNFFSNTSFKAHNYK